jgi:hypothetical protein
MDEQKPFGARLRAPPPSIYLRIPAFVERVVGGDERLGQVLEVEPELLLLRSRDADAPATLRCYPTCSIAHFSLAHHGRSAVRAALSSLGATTRGGDSRGGGGERAREGLHYVYIRAWACHARGCCAASWMFFFFLALREEALFHFLKLTSFTF